MLTPRKLKYFGCVLPHFFLKFEWACVHRIGDTSDFTMSMIIQSDARICGDFT